MAFWAARPHLDFFLPFLRPTVDLLRTIDGIQLWICGVSLRMTPFRGETAVEYAQRRRWVCRSLALEVGLWSARVRTRFLNWGRHVIRRGEHGNQPWYVPLLQWHNLDWLNAQRSDYGSTSSGRTGTRSLPGRPCRRFEEALAWCEATR